MGQVCQKCSDGDLVSCTKERNAPLKHPGKNSRVPGSNGMPNSDMYFTEQDGDNMEYGLPNTLYTQVGLDGNGGFYNSQLGSQQISGYVPSARELQFNENQQKSLLASVSSLPPFDDKTLFNPLRTQTDKLIQLKIRNYIKQGYPEIEELAELQRESLHQYKGKNIKDQKGKGINAHGDKKLITDYAFFEDIIVKMHFIKQTQDDLDRVLGVQEKLIPSSSDLNTNEQQTEQDTIEKQQKEDERTDTLKQTEPQDHEDVQIFISNSDSKLNKL